MNDLPSFTDMMIELLSWPKAWGYQVRELAGRIILADARISWWYSAVGRISSAGSSEGDLELLDRFFEQHEVLDKGLSSCKREEISMDELVAMMRVVAAKVESLLEGLPDRPWLDSA
ncbi:hypothetical protein ACGF07_12115 [Kitasatospora sp. NPDC048194]|uniref:hypothetical protein n=1 Tax=Kitasatospora sp. NPDC048194 TaxID=3364045 RepID=UPI003716F14F